MTVSDRAPLPEQASYTRVAIALHWAIAALLVFEVALGLNMEQARGSAKFAVFQLHKSVGITILLLVLLRIVWRVHRRPPPLNAAGWERALALTVHGAFYALLLALPLSGWLIVSSSKIAIPTLLYGTISWPHLPGLTGMTAAAREAWNGAGEFVHVNLVNLLYLLVALHLAGALKHHFIDRDGELARMIPGARLGAWGGFIAVAAVATAALGLGWGAGAAKPPAVAVRAPAAPVGSLVAAPATVEPAPEASATPAAEESPEAAQEVSSWAIRPGSSLRFRTSYAGEGIVGSFASFSGDIVFAPDQLDKSRVAITIDLGSAASGDGERDETLKGGDFFAIEANRSAVFRADTFRKTGTDRYVAQGTLRLKGMTAPLSLPFTLKIDGDNATMQGSTTIDRLAYRIGEGEFSSTADIPAAVGVEVALKARRK